MAKPTKDDVIRDLIEFFNEGFDNDPDGVTDWLIQGDWDADEFILALKTLKHALTLPSPADAHLRRE